MDGACCISNLVFVPDEQRVRCVCVSIHTLYIPLLLEEKALIWQMMMMLPEMVIWEMRRGGKSGRVGLGDEYLRGPPEELQCIKPMQGIEREAQSCALCCCSITYQSLVSRSNREQRKGGKFADPI